MEQSKERLEVLEKMAEYEKNGWFYKDLENDPPTRPLEPGECDYTQRKLSSKIGTKIANAVGKNFFEKRINDCVLFRATPATGWPLGGIWL